jgi:hypothetical protein
MAAARFSIAPYRDIQTIASGAVSWIANTHLAEDYAGFGPTPIDAMADLIDVMAKALENR